MQHIQYISVKLCFIISFIASSFLSQAQKNEYELFMAGSKIGTLTAERKVKGDVVMYTITTDAYAKILWKEVASYSLTRAIFKNGLLSEAYYEYKENGEVEKYCKTLPAENGYAIHHWKKGKYNVTPAAHLAILNIYFEEPKDGEKYYTENWGEFVTMKKTGEHEYEFKPKDGDKNVYRYSNGKITEADFHTSIVTVKMRPKP